MPFLQQRDTDGTLFLALQYAGKNEHFIFIFLKMFVLVAFSF